MSINSLLINSLIERLNLTESDKHFDSNLYISVNSDLVENGITTAQLALYHYINFGYKEGRIKNTMEFYTRFPTFDYIYYISEHMNDYVVRTERDAIIHYLTTGIYENLSINNGIVTSEVININNADIDVDGNINVSGDFFLNGDSVSSNLSILHSKVSNTEVSINSINTNVIIFYNRLNALDSGNSSAYSRISNIENVLLYSSNISLPNVVVNGNLQVNGDIVQSGTFYTVNTEVTVTDQLLIENVGTAPTLVVNQKNTTSQPIAQFKDDDVNVFTIGAEGYITDNPTISALETANALIYTRVDDLETANALIYTRVDDLETANALVYTRVDDLETANALVYTRIDDLETANALVYTRVDDLETANALVYTRIDDLETANALIYTRVDDLETANALIYTRVDDLETANALIYTRVDEIESNITSITSQLSNIGTSGGSTSTFDSNITSLESGNISIWANLVISSGRLINIESNVNDLQTSNSSLITRATNLESNMSSLQKITNFTNTSNAVVFNNSGNLTTSSNLTFNSITGSLVTSGNLTCGNVNFTGSLYQNGVIFTGSSGSSLSVSGSNGYIQFNSSNVLSSSANLVFYSNTNTLTIPNVTVKSNLIVGNTVGISKTVQSTNTVDIAGHINIDPAYDYRVGNTSVLNSTTLGSGVISSSLQYVYSALTKPSSNGSTNKILYYLNGQLRAADFTNPYNDGLSLGALLVVNNSTSSYANKGPIVNTGGNAYYDIPSGGFYINTFYSTNVCYIQKSFVLTVVSITDSSGGSTSSSPYIMSNSIAPAYVLQNRTIDLHVRFPNSNETQTGCIIKFFQKIGSGTLPTITFYTNYANSVFYNNSNIVTETIASGRAVSFMKDSNGNWCRE